MKQYLYLTINPTSVRKHTIQHPEEYILDHWNCTYYSGIMLFKRSMSYDNEYKWSIHNSFLAAPCVHYDIIKQYDTINEILMDIPELMLL